MQERRRLEDSSRPREFDARDDVDSYVRHHLGTSPQLAAYLPAIIAACLAALPVVGVVGGLILFGLPPPSALGSFLSLLLPAVALLGLMGYYIRKARKGTLALPDRFTMDVDGVWFQSSGEFRDLIEWDSPTLFVTLVDKRQFTSLPKGTTQIVMGLGPTTYPVPAELFDLVIHKATTLGLAGPSQPVTTARGKILRTTVRATRR